MSVMERTPEQYREIIQRFLMEYYNRRRWELEQAFLGLQIPLIQHDLIYNSALADQLCDIARAAGEVIEQNGQNESILQESIQDLMERLFAPPGLGPAYDIPGLFWETDFGRMVARALLWIQHDELVTVSEAAKLRGVSLQAISNAVAAGRLRRFVNPDEPNPQRRTLVSKHDVESM